MQRKWDTDRQFPWVLLENRHLLLPVLCQNGIQNLEWASVISWWPAPLCSLTCGTQLVSPDQSQFSLWLSGSHGTLMQWANILSVIFSSHSTLQMCVIAPIRRTFKAALCFGDSLAFSQVFLESKQEWSGAKQLHQLHIIKFKFMVLLRIFCSAQIVSIQALTALVPCATAEYNSNY